MRSDLLAEGIPKMFIEPHTRRTERARMIYAKE